MATRTGTRVPSLRISSFSKGVQAPNRRPSSCASSSRGAYSGGVRSGQCSRPASKSSRLYPTSSRNASFASGIRSNSPETMPAMVDSAGNWPDARAAAPQLLVPLVTLAEVAHHPGKTLQFSVFVSERHGNDIGPESRPVLSQPASLRCPNGLPPRPASTPPAAVHAESLVAGIEKRYVLADGLIGRIAVNARRSRIPGSHASVRHPVRKARSPAPMTESVAGGTLARGAVLSRRTGRGARAARSLWPCTPPPAGFHPGPASWSVPSCSPCSCKALQSCEI